MLECVAVIINVVIVIVWISKEVILPAKNVGRTDIGLWKECVMRILHFKDFFVIVIQAPAGFVTEVCRSIPVADHLYRVLRTDRAMISRIGPRRR